MPIGPGRPLALEKPCQIDIEQAARYFGARQGSVDAATRALLETCAPPLLTAAAPRAVWLESDVAALSAAGILSGADVMKHLAGCDRAILLAVTLGPGADLQIRRAGVGDIAAGVASDALGSALAEQAADAAGKLGLYVLVSGNDEIAGNIVAVAQDISPGTQVSAGKTVQVTFADPAARD